MWSGRRIDDISSVMGRQHIVGVSHDSLVVPSGIGYHCHGSSLPVYRLTWESWGVPLRLVRLSLIQRALLGEPACYHSYARQQMSDTSV